MRKKMILRISIIAVFAAVLIIGGIVSNAQTSADYCNTGKHNVSIDKSSSYWIFYPTDLAGMDACPLITWGNGTAMKTSVYSKILNHLASHGFIVVASTSTSAGSGETMIAGIDYITELNSDSSSKFYNKIDLEKIGATGHSQGGKGTINAACNDERIKCIVPIQPSKPDDASAITCPTFLITSNKDYIVYSDFFVKPIYNSSKAPTVYASLKNATHTTLIRNPEKMQGYITAWFCTYLKDDSNAATYFEGDNYGLSSDSEWMDVQKKNM